VCNHLETLKHRFTFYLSNIICILCTIKDWHSKRSNSWHYSIHFWGLNQSWCQWSSIYWSWWIFFLEGPIIWQTSPLRKVTNERSFFVEVFWLWKTTNSFYLPTYCTHKNHKILPTYLLYTT
jgi:hypothetical protein